MIGYQQASAELFAALPAQGRTIMALAGPPGAGKSTVAAHLLEAAAHHGVRAVVVPMDGWHLAHSTLERLDLAGVKGAPHTFDAVGFVALVDRLRAQQPGDATIWAPEFRREIEDAVAGAVEIPADARLVIVEGNYLLLDADPWRALAGSFDVAWMLTPSPSLRLERLIARHEAFGRDAVAAEKHATGSDEANARRVLDHVVRDGLRCRVLEVDPG